MGHINSYAPLGNNGWGASLRARRGGTQEQHPPPVPTCAPSEPPPSRPPGGARGATRPTPPQRHHNHPLGPRENPSRQPVTHANSPQFSHEKTPDEKFQPIPVTENRTTENFSAFQPRKIVRPKTPTHSRHRKSSDGKSQRPPVTKKRSPKNSNAFPSLEKRMARNPSPPQPPRWIVRKMSPLQGWRDRCGERVLQRCRASGAPESRNIPRPAPPSLTPRAQL